MGTLKVDNLQKRDGTALITDGAATSSLLSASALRTAGAGMVKLFTQTNVSASSAYDISSTYINSTYDDYQFYIEGTLDTNNQHVRLRYFTSGSLVTSGYGYNNARLDENVYYIDVEGASEIQMARGLTQTTGSFSIEGTLRSVNSTTIPTRVLFKVARMYATDVRGESGIGGQDSTKKTTTVNGLSFHSSSGNIAVARFTLFGIVK